MALYLMSTGRRGMHQGGKEVFRLVCCPNCLFSWVRLHNQEPGQTPGGHVWADWRVSLGVAAQQAALRPAAQESVYEVCRNRRVKHD